MTTETDAKLIEAGRKLFAGDWRFTFAAPSIETLPPMAGLEVAVNRVVIEHGHVISPCPVLELALGHGRVRGPPNKVRRAAVEGRWSPGCA